MKLRTITYLFCLAPLAVADEVRLNDGTVYKDCVVESENAKEVTILVPVSKTIKDSKTIARDQIAQIIKSTEDEKKFADINRRYGDLKGLNLDDMKKGLELSETFIAENEKSKVFDQAKKLAETLKAEIAKQEAATEEADQGGGEAKDKQYTPEELKRSGYDIEANKLLDKFKSKVKQNNAIAAMLAFDELSQNFNASEAYAESRKTTARILPKLVENLEKGLKDAEKREQDIVKEESQRTIKLSASVNAQGVTTPEQRAALNEARNKWNEEVRKRREERKELKDKFREELSKIRDRKLRWYNPVPGLSDSYRDLVRVAKADLDRVNRELQYPDSDKAGKGSAALKKGWEALDQGKLDEATEALADVKSCRIARDYWEPLDAELKAAKTAAYEQKRAEREAERAKQLEERRKQQQERSKATMKDLNDKLKEMKGEKADDKKKDEEKK